MSPHHVTFEAEYVERRSRLTTAFRLILAIPHLILLSLYAIAAWIVAFVAWFVLIFTARYPQGMYDFVADFLRYQTRVYGYVHLLTDAYPPFTGSTQVDYPVRLRIPPPKPEYSRLKTVLRPILAIPVYLIAYAMQVVAQIGALLSWFAIVFVGRQPRGLQDMTALGLSYQLRSTAYLLLLTEDWPAFIEEEPTGVGSAPAFGALPADERAGSDRPASTAPRTFEPPPAREEDPPTPPPTLS